MPEKAIAVIYHVLACNAFAVLGLQYCRPVCLGAVYRRALPSLQLFLAGLALQHTTHDSSFALHPLRNVAGLCMRSDPRLFLYLPGLSRDAVSLSGLTRLLLTV